MSGCWLFGYGSLVSRTSFEHTLGRHLTPGDDFHEAQVDGFARRWAFSIRSVPAAAVRTDRMDRMDRGPDVDAWTITVLGLVASPSQSVNGVIGWVTDDELAEFDRRERTYARADVTSRTAGGGAPWRAGSVVTYVPTAVPRDRYERGRADGSAVVDARYWQLVEAAFTGLGAVHLERYRASTPAPEVPIVSIDVDHVPASHLAGDG